MPPHPVVSPAVRVACALVGVPVFALSVAVQHNDPDPLPWMAIYASAALLCAARAAGRVVVVPAAVVAVIATVWMVTLSPAAVRWLGSDHDAVSFTIDSAGTGPRPPLKSFASATEPQSRLSLRGSMKTGDAGEELAREAGGLGLVALAAALLVVEGRRRRGG